MRRIQVLLIEDDTSLISSISSSLKNENIEVIAVTNGYDALSILEKEAFDVILTELTIRDIDGFEIIRQLRNDKNYTPIIIISERNEEHNQILGLGLGADDYMTKPISYFLLVSKIKALFRRSNMYSATQSTYLSAGPFKFENETFQIYKNNKLIELTSKETMMMKFFIENPNQVFTKEQLYRKLWNDTIIDDNTIMVYIKRLRDKIEDNPRKPEFLKTIWGIGYRLEV